jgi:hypothetical protein
MPTRRSALSRGASNSSSDNVSEAAAFTHVGSRLRGGLRAGRPRRGAPMVPENDDNPGVERGAGLAVSCDSGCPRLPLERFTRTCTGGRRTRRRFDSHPDGGGGRGIRSGWRLARPGSGQGVAMEFRILGSFEVVGSAGLVDPRGAKRRGPEGVPGGPCRPAHEHRPARRGAGGRRWQRGRGAGRSRPMCRSCASCWAPERSAW